MEQHVPDHNRVNLKIGLNKNISLGLSQGIKTFTVQNVIFLLSPAK